MEYNKLKYDQNEKLVYNIGLGVFASSIALFILTIFMIENFDFLSKVFEALAVIGVIASAGLVIIGNVRVFIYIINVRKLDSKAQIWKSVITIFVSLISIFVYWLNLLVLVFQSF